MDTESKKQCVYCLRWFAKLTEDHVFPRSWYPDSTPPTIEKWDVPACSKCNTYFSRVEQELLIRMGLCLDPQSEASSGIPQKALTAINPKLAKNDRDRRARQKLRKQILGDTFRTQVPNMRGMLPSFGPQEGRDYGGEYLAIKIPAGQLKVLARKFVRGLLYKLENGLLITADYSIDVYHAEDEKVTEVTALIERVGHTDYRGAGVKVQRAVGDLKSIGALFRITMWERWTVYAVVQPLNRKA